MRVLIVDDSDENLEAAKQAAEGFSGYEFQFTNRAKEGIVLLTKADAVITDLFFPNEDPEDEGELGTAYAQYRSKMIDNPAFDEVVRSYYNGESWKAEQRLEDALSLLEDGTIRGALERIIRFNDSCGDDFSKELADEFREVLRNLPAPLFPYGGAVMLRAKELGKRHCLVSDIHRHAGKFKDAPSAIDGMVLLLPLMGEGIVSVAEARRDGKDSLTYIGSEAISSICVLAALEANRMPTRGKNDPAVWSEAIRRILAQ